MYAQNAMKKLILLVLIILSLGAQRAEAAAPVTDPFFSNTNLLLHMNGTNGSTTFTDQMSHSVTAVGSAQISTAQSKFGGASGSFNGSTDYLTIPDSDDWNYGSGDFTIETWVRFSSLASNQAIVDQYTDAGTTVPAWQLVYITGVGMYFAYHNGTSELITLNSGTSGWATNTWYHVAVVRSGTTWTMYRDGTSVAQVTGNSTTMPDIVGALWIGNRNYGGNSAPLNGYLDDLRITKGVARYTAAFTAPTAAFPNLGPTAECTGGVITRSGGYTIHTFLSSGTFTCPLAKSTDYLVVAGGGGGAHGGGGAGGLLQGSGFAVSARAYSITVGSGGAGVGANNGAVGGSGGNSIFSSLTAIGGGGGGYINVNGATTGGSGGGSGGTVSGSLGANGTSGQGNKGGDTTAAIGNNQPSGGGGGASAVGQDAQSATISGNGGNGTTSSISGASVTYAGGGGGGHWTTGTAGSGGTGGGGAGGNQNSVANSQSGTVNTGGGGGGAGSSAYVGGSGGSGIVIVRYLTPAVDCTGGNITYANGRTIHTFLSGGTLTCSGSKSVEALVVAGGGGGGSRTAGGGGAGGLVYNAAYAVTAGAKTVTVGSGGSGGSGGAAGSSGSNSVFDAMTALGGGGGATQTDCGGSIVHNGGSGGGGAYCSTTAGAATQGNSGGGTGYGNNGSAGYDGYGTTGTRSTGGGGGAGGAGVGVGGAIPNGGVGRAYSISGVSTYYAGGGGGGDMTLDVSAYTAGAGGNGGGGAGGTYGGVGPYSGTANTGGGGGGVGNLAAGANGTGGAGGSGIVIVSYPTASIYASTAKNKFVGTKLTLKGLKLSLNTMKDQYFSYVTALLHMDGNNGSTSFTDVKGHAVTANGSAQISTAQSKFGGASGYFNGTTSYLSTPNATDLDFYTGDFTLEFWVRPTQLLGSNLSQAIYSKRLDSSNFFDVTLFDNGSNYSVQTSYVSGGVQYINTYPSTYDISPNVWTHIAIVRSGTSMKTFINGTIKADHTATAGGAAITNEENIGRRSDGAIYFQGYLDDIRITKGVARYTTAFTPPTVPYPN